MALVRHFTETEAKPVLEGVKMRMVIGPDQGAPVFNMRVFDVQPGAATPFHSHWWEHEVFILEGSGDLKLTGEKIPLAPGSAILVERNEQHQFVNTGPGILRFMCLVPQEWLESQAGDSKDSVCSG